MRKFGKNFTIIDKQNLKNLQLDEIMDYFEDNISNNDFFSY
jgi:hypothetical protein